MFELLIRFIFLIVTSLVQIFLSPIINTIVGLIPDAQVFFTNIVNFLTFAFTYLQTILHWFLFTNPMFLALFDYFAIKFSIWVVASTIRLGLNLYHKLKP